MQAVAVDLGGRDHLRTTRSAQPSTAAEQLLALLRRDLLRVVQQRERADAVVAQAGVVEQDSGDDERARERTAAGLVGARDEACAELAIEAEEAVNRGAGHGGENQRRRRS